MTKFIIVRHGQSETNVENRYAGWYDAQLTETGVKQAAFVTEYVLSAYRIDAVYSSDLSRAKNTVKEIASRLGLPHRTEKGLREMYGGIWEGKRTDEIAKIDPEQANLWLTDIGKVHPTGGESFADVQKRVVETLEKIAAENEGKTVLIGTHGGVIRVLQCYFEGKKLEDLKNVPWTPNASVSEVDFDRGAFTPVVFGYAKHLGDMVTNAFGE